jgi:menaquinone-dependent protoporphyrinogen oxidase
MTNKILVTYSTMTGSTEGVSEAIGKTLTDLGESVDVIPMRDVKDLTFYKAVIAGSAIQAAKWLPEANDFIQTYKQDLKQKQFAAFLVCMTLAMPKGESYRDHVTSWLEPIRHQVTPISEGFFTGILDIKKVPSFADRIKFRLSVMFGVWKEGDHRDWDAIQNWTRNLKSILDKK